MLFCTLLLCGLYAAAEMLSPAQDEVTREAMSESAAIRKEMSKGVATEALDGFNVYYIENGAETEVGAVRFDGEEHAVHFDSVRSAEYADYPHDLAVDPEDIENAVDNIHFLEFRERGSEEKTKFDGNSAVDYINDGSGRERERRIYRVFNNLVMEYCEGSMRDLRFVRDGLADDNDFDDSDYVADVMARFNRFEYVSGR